PDINEHVRDLHGLLPVLGREQVGRLGADDTHQLPLTGEDPDPLGQHHLAPPAAQGLKPEKTFLGDVGDEKAHLVQMTGDHHPRALRPTPEHPGHPAQVVGDHLVGDGLQVPAHHLPGWRLKTRNPRSLRQLLEHLPPCLHAHPPYAAPIPPPWEPNHPWRALLEPSRNLRVTNTERFRCPNAVSCFFADRSYSQEATLVPRDRGKLQGGRTLP